MDMNGKEKSLCYYVYAKFSYSCERKTFLGDFLYPEEASAFVSEFLDLFQKHGILDTISSIIIEPVEVVEVKE